MMLFTLLHVVLRMVLHVILFGIALNVARSFMHGTLTAKHFPMM